MLSITADQGGLYEITLPPGQVVVIDVAARRDVIPEVQITAHAGDGLAVYVKPGDTVTAQDPNALQVNIGSIASMMLIHSTTHMSLISAEGAVVSVIRL